MNKKKLTIFLSRRNRYYNQNIDIISSHGCCFSTVSDPTILGENFSLYSINKIISTIDSCYLLFLDDETQLNSAHFQKIISQLHQNGEDYYYFQALYLDKDKWIPSPHITSQSNFREFCKYTNGANQFIIRKNFITAYFSIHDKLDANIFKDKHILFYLYKNFSKTNLENVISLRCNQYRHEFHYKNEPEKIFSDFSQILLHTDDNEFIEEIYKILIELLFNLLLTKKAPLERLDFFLTIKNHILSLWPKQLAYIEIFGQKISLSTFSAIDPVDLMKLIKII